MNEPMDKTKIAKMDMEAFRQLKDLEADRDKWKQLAIDLATAGFCDYCNSRESGYLEDCPDTQGWHEVWSKVQLLIS
jgi:hypothetical protein